jgi:hypothetical protein
MKSDGICCDIGAERCSNLAWTDQDPVKSGAVFDQNGAVVRQAYKVFCKFGFPPFLTIGCGERKKATHEQVAFGFDIRQSSVGRLLIHKHHLAIWQANGECRRFING